MESLVFVRPLVSLLLCRTSIGASTILMGLFSAAVVLLVVSSSDLKNLMTFQSIPVSSSLPEPPVHLCSLHREMQLRLVLQADFSLAPLRVGRVSRCPARWLRIESLFQDLIRLDDFINNSSDIVKLMSR